MIEISGYTLIPLKVYFKNNKVKVEIGICKGNKYAYDFGDNFVDSCYYRCSICF